MRRSLALLVVTATFLGPSPFLATAVSASGVPMLPCAATSVRVTDYNTVVGAGNVNDLFWIKNVGSQACTLRGYVHVAYVGHYGLSLSKKIAARPLSVDEVHTPGRDGNDLGGLKKGVVLPTAILSAHGGVASFWIYGTDESHNLPPTRCIISYKMWLWLPGSQRALNVEPLRGNGFYWCGGIAVHPIVPGESGSDPSVALSYYFGTPS